MSSANVKKLVELGVSSQVAQLLDTVGINTPALIKAASHGQLEAAGLESAEIIDLQARFPVQGGEA